MLSAVLMIALLIPLLKSAVANMLIITTLLLLNQVHAKQVQPADQVRSWLEAAVQTVKL